MSSDDGDVKVVSTQEKLPSENGAADNEGNVEQKLQDTPKVEPPEADEFGLPVKPPRRRWVESEGEDDAVNGEEVKPEVPEKDEAAVQEVVDGPKEVEQAAAVVESPTAIREEEGEQDAQRERAATLDDIADRPRDRRDTANSRKDGKANSRPSTSHAQMNVSEWSHQQLAPRQEVAEEKEGENEWQEMPALATHRIYDDWGKVLAREYDEVDDEFGYSNVGGAGKGYTRVQDDDAASATSMDDNTAYLFKEPHKSNALDEDEEGRDAVSQMQTTKELLTEGQRIAYVGVVRLSIGKMLDNMRKVEYTKATRKQIDFATEATVKWGQKMMVRLYSHMEINSSEQVMVEQLAEHGVLPSDLTPALMQNARVKNPTKVESKAPSITSARPSLSSLRPSSTAARSPSITPAPQENEAAPPAYESPPAYEQHTADELTVQDTAEIEDKKNIDLDIRWTVLCDIFLLLIADSTYDARSRTLLEYVAESLEVSWQEVCRFEKRVTDALEMQEQADKENWNEDEHIEARKKAARNKRLLVMGLCTVGGGLIIGLSAGAMAPLIGPGLAAGFGAIGVSGTGGFFGGAGAVALIGSGGALTGGIVGGRASNRRTGAVKTFEYRPLFNNKRPNLIVTVAGWMTGNVDDVRLPFSTVDSIMGDIYSIHWEPEMLQSTGQTIQILATEALTQTIQQILGYTVLTGLMAGLTAPIILTKLSYLIDNPWTVSLARADASGLILADSLIDRNLGLRPITLVGFSLGARVIFSCLKELARRGAVGLVQNVYLFGSPVIAKKDEYTRARTVVSGRFVNGYATNDWILGYLFRATSGGIMRVSGLSSVDVAGIENRDFTELVPGHMAYRGMMPSLLEEVGWLVDSLEFTEIEDPDPENHERRQRELIDEIEAARQELDTQSAEKQKKGGIRAFFSRKKAPEKKVWETYDERSMQNKVAEGEDMNNAERIAEENSNVMFDVDAIRTEALRLALQEGADIDEIKRHLNIRELESTLPALKISSVSTTEQTNGTSENGEGSANELRQTKSHNDSIATHAESQSLPSEEKAEVPSTNGHETPAREVSPANTKQNHTEIISEKSPSISTSTPEPSHGTSTPPVGSKAHARPALRSVSTTPNPLPADTGFGIATSPRVPPPLSPELHSPDHNPWSDGEEEGGEVKMSFE